MATHKISSPATIMISGPSGCGKSTLVEQLITRASEAFDVTPDRVVFCYSRDQSLYADIARKSTIPIEFVQGLPADLKPAPNSLVIIDDLQGEGPTISDWFTKNSHHFNCSVMYLVQNLFLNTPHHRTCNLNTHVLCVFKNPRDKVQVMCLARQISPENPKFILSAFSQATEMPHGYLVFNLKQATPDHLRLRDSFFDEATFFVDKKNMQTFDLVIQ